MPTWNPWHGCTKISEGCRNCYVYRIDEHHGRDASVVQKTSEFDLPIKKNKNGYYKLVSDETVFTCFSSDFFLPAADKWRGEIWKMMKLRADLDFFIITKRIDRFEECKPDDWRDGYENVTICSTAENQDRADYRLPILLSSRIKHKQIICEPLLERMDISRYLTDEIESVTVGGESGPAARECDYEWVLSLKEQCDKRGIRFYFKQTGAKFRKDGKLYNIPRKEQHKQAYLAGINTYYPFGRYDEE